MFDPLSQKVHLFHVIPFGGQQPFATLQPLKLSAPLLYPWQVYALWYLPIYTEGKNKMCFVSDMKINWSDASDLHDEDDCQEVLREERVEPRGEYVGGKDWGRWGEKLKYNAVWWLQVGRFYKLFDTWHTLTHTHTPILHISCLYRRPLCEAWHLLGDLGTGQLN